MAAFSSSRPIASGLPPGLSTSVSDTAIYDAQEDLARKGFYCEPAGAAAYAGCLQAMNRGAVEEKEEWCAWLLVMASRTPNPS